MGSFKDIEVPLEGKNVSVCHVCINLGGYMCVILPVKVQWVVIWKGADAIEDGGLRRGSNVRMQWEIRSEKEVSALSAQCVEQHEWSRKLYELES